MYSLPFFSVNQELGQAPLTFLRQVLSLVEYPDLLKPENREWLEKMYAPDAIARVESYLAAGMPSSGSYTHSQGNIIDSVRYIRIARLIYVLESVLSALNASSHARTLSF